MLAVHGARPAAPPAASDTVPGDVAWAVYQGCLNEVPTFSGSAAVGLREGRITVDVIGTGLDPEEAQRIEDQLNGCLAEFPIGGEGIFGAPSDLVTQAERLELYDYGMRWMLPCLSARGQLNWSHRIAREYLSDYSALWADYYFALVDQSADAVIAARRACGSGSDILARG
ncbi:hypothetical protein [Protaetiibacter mangrovi]|uniref:Uncharacterized protein n=1 Tax=Protaetiibacter mangrovi TaxID=2970926 RepID=A0ABT1ZEZ6_9MICO|nr:hypothetical protein [Protaetiibacter mangrovi]MCS0499290.1 hypothetical protein [Protaetiibacter mangrovi]TPX04149.1 hypothetical protein FJ656_13390 [Schumannella luteola]